MKEHLSISIACILVINLVKVANAQDIFLPDYRGNAIIEITPGGTESTFASGLNHPFGLAINSMGDLFTADDSLNIYKLTPDGTQSTFASYSSYIHGLACDSAGDLFAADYFGGNIIEITRGGT